MHDRASVGSVLFLFILTSVACGNRCVAQAVDWPAYNGSKDGEHYSRLTQIDKTNVHELKVAWTFDSGEKGSIQANPLVVGGILYAYTPTLKVVALDAATGELKWKFDSGMEGTQPARGFSWWTDGRENRLFAGVMNFLYCLDPATGKPIASFGENGRVDLRKGLREPFEQQSIVLTTPGMIYKDMIIVGGRNPETHPAPPGDIRAFDVRTGQLRWVFHTIPRPGEKGYETWPPDAWKNAGAANNWAGMALDEKRGVIFVPTGSAVMDFYGGDRVGDDLYANTLLALDANTGKRLWHFQGVHHDIWDRDFPSAPALFTLQRDGKTIEALAQTTKQGFVYLFDRSTGKPLYPVHERPYPASTVPGEVAAPTQPLPDWPEPFARQRLTEDMLTTRTPEAHAWAVKEFQNNIRSGGQFLPFALEKQTVVFPGFDGGAEWGGPAIDPVHNVLFVNANEMVWLGGLTPVGQAGSPGEQVYRQQCAVCHGLDRSGSPPAFPALTDVGKRLTDEKIAQTVKQGVGRMPSFPNLSEQRIGGLLEFLHTPAKAAADKKEMASDAQQPAPKAHEEDTAGRAVYANRCAICHGDNREGIPPSFPMLIGLGARMSAEQTAQFIHVGKGRMPPMPNLQGAGTRVASEVPGSKRRRRSTRSCRAAGLHLHRVPEVSRPGWLPGVSAALGHAERHRPEDREIPVEGEPGRVSGAGGARHEGYGLGELRRANCDRERRAVHWGHGSRPQIPRLRYLDRQAVVGSAAALLRRGYTGDLHGGRQAVRRDRGQRGARSEDAARRGLRGVRPALNPVGHRNLRFTSSAYGVPREGARNGR